MPNFKCVYQYTQPNKGFTETYYRTSTNLAAAATWPQSFNDQLRRNKHPLTVLNKARVSDVANNRNAVVVPINQPGLDSEAGPDITGTAAIVTLVAPSIGASRKVWLRGLADGSTIRDPLSGVDTPSPNFLSAITFLLSGLAAQGFVVRSLTKLTVLPNAYISILSVDSVAGQGFVTLNIVGGGAGLAGTQIIISQVNQKVFPGLKGLFTVTSATAVTLTVAYNPLTTGHVLLSKGRFRPATFLFGPIDPNLSAFSNFGSRATGKNPLGGRGARRGTRGLRLA